MRDKDVRLAIKKLLEETNQFNLVSLKGLPAQKGAPAGDLAFAVIQPDTINQMDRWDSGEEALNALAPIGLEITSTVLVTVMSRNEDPQIRDERAENLAELAINTIQGKALAGLTCPDLTRFVNARFLPEKPPERRVVLLFRYVYILDGWAAYDVDKD
jgi:hypothetical protein